MKKATKTYILCVEEEKEICNSKVPRIDSRKRTRRSGEVFGVPLSMPIRIHEYKGSSHALTDVRVALHKTVEFIHQLKCKISLQLQIGMLCTMSIFRFFLSHDHNLAF